MTEPEKPETRPVDPSRIAGRYRIDHALAEGGMGAVYCVTDERTGEALALKRLRRADTADLLALFEREYRTLAGIQHPRIIRVFDYGVDAGAPYYTMELVEGRDLHELAPVPFEQACRYLRDVATCLALLHTRRLLHRDITPRNVRVTPDGHCKLFDFGALTSFGIPDRTVGTPPCVPPEALRGAPLDQRADLFSFGAFAYFMLTGRHAYRARELHQLPEVWRTRPAPPSKYAPSIPKAVDALILGLLQLDPSARPGSIAEVVERLNWLVTLPPEDEATQHALAESYLVHCQFVGRGPEIASLREDLVALQRGQGSATLIEAPAGVGRTRLLGELVLQSQLLGVPAIFVDAGMHRQTNGTAIAILHQLLTVSPIAMTEARSRSAILGQLDRSVAERLGPSPGVTEVAVSGDRRARIQEALHHLVASACQSDPLLLVIDDVQEADEYSLALLATLQRLTHERALSLVCSAPSDGQENASFSYQLLRDRSRKIELDPLTQTQILELARSLFGEPPNLARFAEWMYQRSAGRPLHCMEIARRLHTEGVIRYRDGLWVLPDDPPDTAVPEDLDELMAQRLNALSSGARRTAEAMAVQVGTLSREQSIALARAEHADPFVLLEELVRADVLSENVQGFHFTHRILRERLLSRMPDERRRAVHLQHAEQLLRDEDAANPVLASIEAGWHLLQAGEESRGAELIARIAHDSIDVRFAIADLQVAAPALEAALAVYKKQGRSLYELTPLLSALAAAGYYERRVWAERYGKEALAAVLHISGVGLAAKLQRYLGKTLGLITAMSFAWLRFVTTPRRQRQYSFRDVLMQLFAVVSTLTGTSASGLDAESAELFASALRPFAHLPERLTPTGIAQYCDALKEITRENQAFALRTWTRLLERFSTSKYYISLPDDARQLYVGGLWFARGVFESFRDGRGALHAADQLDASGLKMYHLIASELRLMYHAHRGELKEAQRYRAEVELHAILLGTAAQVELWEPAALILAYASIGDVVELRRVTDRLVTLAKTYPWLGSYAELAQSALDNSHTFLDRESSGGAASSGARARAEAAIARTLDFGRAREPRSFIGWAAVWGYTARGLNIMGRYEEGREICQDALSHLGPDDRPFVALFLTLEIELAVAEAGLGELASSRSRLDELLSYHAQSDNPLTRGRLHEGYARVAAIADDWSSFRHHLEEMNSWYRSTGTPALAARFEALAVLQPNRSSLPPRPSLPPVHTHQTTATDTRTRQRTGTTSSDTTDDALDAATVMEDDVAAPVDTRRLPRPKS